MLVLQLVHQLPVVGAQLVGGRLELSVFVLDLTVFVLHLSQLPVDGARLSVRLTSVAAHVDCC